MDLNIEQLADEMPDFANHEEAEHWFKEKFQDSLKEKGHEESEGMNIYYYHIIKNQQAYDQYLSSLEEDGEANLQNGEAFRSYTTLEIAENGDVSISL